MPFNTRPDGDAECRRHLIRPIVEIVMVFDYNIHSSSLIIMEVLS